MKKYLIFGYDKEIVKGLLSKNHEVHLVLDKWDLMDDISKSKLKEEKWLIVNDSTNIENVLEIINQNNNMQKYDIIFSRYESTIIIAATLSEFMSKEKFLDLKTAIAFRDKFLQKSILKDHLNLAKFHLIKNVIDFDTASIDLQFPFVAKPYNGAGTAATYLIKNMVDLKEKLLYYKNENKLTILLEEFIEGVEYQVDGFIYNDKINFLISQYGKPVLNIQNGFILNSITMNPKKDNTIYSEVKPLILLALKKLNLTNNVFHMELFHTAKKQWYFSECAARIGGALSNDLFEKTYQKSLSTILLEILENKKTEIELNVSNLYYGYSFIQPLNKNVLELPKEENLKKIFPNVEKVVYEWKPGQDIPNAALNSVKRTGMILIQAPSREKIQETIQKLYEYFENWGKAQECD